MFAPTKFFRVAGRHLQPLRPVSLGVNSSRHLSSTPPARNAEDKGSSEHAPLVRELHNADAALKERAEAAKLGGADVGGSQQIMI